MGNADGSTRQVPSTASISVPAELVAVFIFNAGLDASMRPHFVIVAAFAAVR